MRELQRQKHTGMKNDRNTWTSVSANPRGRRFPSVREGGPLHQEGDAHVRHLPSCRRFEVVRESSAAGRGSNQAGARASEGSEGRLAVGVVDRAADAQAAQTRVRASEEAPRRGQPDKGQRDERG